MLQAHGGSGQACWGAQSHAQITAVHTVKPSSRTGQLCAIHQSTSIRSLCLPGKNRCDHCAKEVTEMRQAWELARVLQGVKCWGRNSSHGRTAEATFHTTSSLPLQTGEVLNPLCSSEVTFRKLNLELHFYTSLPKLKTPGG